jgi:hypothetical protein
MNTVHFVLQTVTLPCEVKLLYASSQPPRQENVYVVQTQTRMQSRASQQIERRDQPHVSTCTTQKRNFPLGYGWRRWDRTWDHPPLRRHKTTQHLFALRLPTADAMCHVATVAPFVLRCCNKGIIPGYDKTEDFDQMSHPLYDVERAMRWVHPWQGSRIIRLNVPILLIGPERWRNSICTVF